MSRNTGTTSTPHEAEPLLLKVGEACERTRLGRTALNRLLHSGELPSVKIGGARRIPVVDLEEFLGRLRAEGVQRSTAHGR